MFDKLHEECGVVGIWSPDNMRVSRQLYCGLIALQHRGQESAGIATCNTRGPLGNICIHKGMGLVSEIFTDKELDALPGNMGIGHVRYSTSGESTVSNAQPIFFNYIKGTLALVHNGNITNVSDFRNELENNGAIFTGSTDSEVIAYKVAMERLKCHSVEEALKTVSKELKGGFALILMSPRKLVAIRDPFGLKPLCLGKVEDSYILASESAVIQSLNGEFIRDIEPGEMITITQDGIKSDKSLSQPKKAHCVFEYIYFARLDSTIDGINVYEARINGGKALAKHNFVEADVVTGVPESGIAAAIGYAQEAEIPFQMVFHKNSYIGRTFIKPTQEERTSSVHMKLSVLKSVVKGKRIVLIDDSIVRGTTIANLITMLKQEGALEVHVRISSPPFLHPCFYGTDVPDNKELIANSLSIEEIRKFIGADSLAYMQIEDFREMTGDLPLCQACFNGEYPI